MSSGKPFFLSQNTGLGNIEAKDELLHPVQNASVKADSLTETQYFGFCIPEERIHGYAYLWHHPNLRIVGGGLFVWRGHKVTTTHAELCDYRDYMNDSVLQDDLHEYRLENGYGVKVVEPLKRHHLTYADPKRNNAVDLDFEAALPPVMYGDGKHFEQAMKVKGNLTLRGKTYAVDCFTVRDRSWAKPRPEDHMPIPGISWMQGVFNEDFAFNCNITEQASSTPELVGTPLALPEDKTLNGGWLHRDGKLGRLVSGKKRVVRTRETRMPTYIEFEVTDEHGRTIHVRGTSVASIAWQPWTNLYMPIALMRWECEGHVAHGDCQDGLWNDFLNLPQ